MGTSVKISAIVIKGGAFDQSVFNECLKSLSFADEIVQIEADSLEGSFSDFRNLGAKKAKFEWLIYLDTDEIITPYLAQVINTVVKSDHYSAYAIPRRNFVFGQEMKHCGLWPDYVLRLIKKDCLLTWEGKLHEQPKITGKVFNLTEPLIHHKHDRLNEMVDKTNKWSEIEAELMYKANHPKMNFVRFFSAGVREFWFRMIIQTAFLDGAYGVIYGLYQVYSRLISYSKLWELQLKNASSNT